MAFHTRRVRALGVLAGAAVLVTVAALVATAPRGAPIGEPTPSTSPSPRAVIDEIVASVLTDDADALGRRFVGVTARAGPILGGPIGIYRPTELTTAEWTSLLGPAKRSLHALVKDPREPFPWWDQQPLPTPRAAILAAPRDFDIVLVVEGADGQKHPWRFSVANDRVIDVVVDRGTDPSGFDRPLVRKLGYLTPSPDDEPQMFLVLPAQEMRPPPRGIAFGPGPGQGPSAPVTSPSVAPSGRTGDPVLDAVVDRLVNADAAALRAAYPDLAASQETCDPSCEDVRVSPTAWVARLTAARRSLYAVFTSDPVDVEILLTVDTGGAVAEAWRFGVEAGKLGQIDIFVPSSIDRDLSIPLLVASGHAPSPARDYARFYVLPPSSALPSAPTVHPITSRTGDPDLDALLATLESRDPTRLLSAFSDPERPLVRKCYGTASTQDRAYAESWSRSLAVQLYGLHAIVRLPAGYQPEADHLVIAVRQLDPLWWDGVGIIERGGAIVGLITDDGSCSPEAMYPPAGYLVSPPTDGRIDPSRRSGIAMIDRILDAAAARDEAAMAALIDYTQRPCGPSGGPPGTDPPQCPSGSPAGTLVDILPWTVCEGGFATRDSAPRSLIAEIGPEVGAGLYAVLPASATVPAPTAPPSPPFAVAVLVLARGDTVTLAVGERGVSSVSRTCGPMAPENVTRSAQPSFLLPPP